jgi:hypothetical protein
MPSIPPGGICGQTVTGNLGYIGMSTDITAGVAARPILILKGKPMTLLDVVFKYGTPPGEKEMGALNNAWEVYGVRKIKFDEREHTIRVEYDASRLNDGEIAGILRRAGIDLREKVQLV